MRIIPFRNPLTKRTTPEVQDWSQQELADFYRAHRLLVENGVNIGIDRGVSDTGDPWVAFFDVATQDVFMHVARIDRSCVLLCDQFNIRIVASNVGDLITRFENEVQGLVRYRQERNSNVILHPAARIIMSISAIFLLFKFENGGTAHAKGVSDLGVNEFATRKQDIGLTGRLQSAIGRIYDAIDTPAAVAALAGVILTIELANMPVKTAPSVELHNDLHVEHALLDNSHEAGLKLDDASGKIETAQDQKSEIASVAFNIDTAKLLSAVEIALKTTSGESHVPAASVAVEQASSPWSAPHGGAAPEPQVGQAPVVQANAPIVTEHPSQSSGTQTAANTQAAKAVETLIPTLAATTVPATTATTPSTSTSAPVATTTAVAAADHMPTGIGEISLATLSSLDSVVGLLRTTELSGAELTATLSHFLSAFGNVEVELAAGGVLIEQAKVASLSGHDVGMWTNLMSDGSEITVVGQIGVIDSVTASV